MDNSQSTCSKPLVKRVYLYFRDKKIGRKLRRDSKFKIIDEISESNADCWTPFSYKTEKIVTSTNSKDHIIRSQFKLIEAEAMTVHKSQGQTFEEIAVKMASLTTLSLIYVALGRVTKLSSSICLI